MFNFHYQDLGENDEILMFVLSGRLDTTQCDYLYSVIEKQIEKGRKKLILDCFDLQYVSSLGLGMMLRIHSKMKKLGGDVRLVGVSGLVADVLRVVKLDRILQIYDTVEAAVEDIERDG